MPIYEYECTKCGKVFEAVQRITDEPLGQCVSCAGPVKRLISQCSFQLKGSGWYVTDYKRGGSTSSSPPASTSGNGGNGSSKTSETADAKPETTTKETPKAEASGGTT
jgi:putative FmdB family regulatory protein